MRVVALPEPWRGRALVISEVSDPRSWFTTDELRAIDAFPRPRRREEWMLSRIAEKELRRRGASGVCRSYSHRGPYGAAAVAEDPVGIDVEIAREMRADSARFFLTGEEADDARRCALPRALLHFWCAKEAAWKRRGGVVLTLSKVPLKLKAETATGLRFDSVETFATGDVVVALTSR